MMNSSLVFEAFVVLLIARRVLATNSTEDTGNGCTLLVPPDVQKQMEPQGYPLQISMEFMNIRIRDVPNRGGSYGVEFRMMATWMDKRYINQENERRLNDCKNMDVVWTERNQFWVPNLFVNDVIEIGGYLSEQDKPGTAGNRLLWYDVSKGLFYLAMFSYASIYCPMDFNKYPFDTQQCHFIMNGPKNASYLEFVNNINYKFISNVTELFDLRFDSLKKTRVEVGGDEFSTTGFSILLRRAPKSHLTNTYLPSGTLTFMSFISFLIPADVVPGRMALLVTIFLMLVNISTMAAHRGPVTRDLTALDSWFLMCVFFVAMALFEYATLLWIKFKKRANGKSDRHDREVEAKCRRIDQHALIVFIALHGAAMSMYFFVAYNYYESGF